jgi:hypothetical protein
MTKLGSLILVIYLAIALSLATTAEAQLAKRGTYTSQFGWHSIVKTLELEKDHFLVTLQSVGTNFNDAGHGFLHAAAVDCFGLNDIVKGAANAHGSCTATDADGDKAFVVWKCRSPQPAARCEGDFQWTGGTGKYTGLKGANTFNGGVVPKTVSGYSVWKGEWQLPE